MLLPWYTTCLGRWVYNCAKRQFRWKIRLIKNGCVAFGGGGGGVEKWGRALVFGVNKNRLNECQFTPQHVTPLSFLTGKISHSLELKRGHSGLKI